MKTKEMRELNEAERFTLNYFLGCTDGEISFAVIGPQCVLFLEDISSSDGEEKIREAMEDAIDMTLRNPPDFEARIMDDGYGLVIVGQAAIVTEEKLNDEVLANKKINVGPALFLRNRALGICEEAELIAAAFAD